MLYDCNVVMDNAAPSARFAFKVCALKQLEWSEKREEKTSYTGSKTLFASIEEKETYWPEVQ